MSSSKYSNLIKEHSQYIPVFNAVFDWFDKNPDKQDVRTDDIYIHIHDLDPKLVTEAFYFLSRSDYFKRVFRLIDNKGRKIGQDYESIFDIPELVIDRDGFDLDTSEATPIPFILKNNV